MVYVPVVHISHTIASTDPEADEYVPTGQAEQVPEPVAPFVEENFPAAHARHILDPFPAT